MGKKFKSKDVSLNMFRWHPNNGKEFVKIDNIKKNHDKGHANEVVYADL